VSDREPRELSAGMLRCIECAVETTDGYGWRAFLTIDDERSSRNEAPLRNRRRT
jgi:hypothetical protein